MMLKAQDGSTVCIEPNLPSNTTRYVNSSYMIYIRATGAPSLMVMILTKMQSIKLDLVLVNLETKTILIESFCNNSEGEHGEYLLSLYR